MNPAARFGCVSTGIGGGIGEDGDAERDECDRGRWWSVGEDWGLDSCWEGEAGGVVVSVLAIGGYVWHLCHINVIANAYLDIQKKNIRGLDLDDAAVI